MSRIALPLAVIIPCYFCMEATNEMANILFVVKFSTSLIEVTEVTCIILSKFYESCRGHVGHLYHPFQIL